MKRFTVGVTVIVLLIPLLAPPVQTTTAQDGSWHVESVQNVAQQVADIVNPAQLFAAPDARQVAYSGPDRQICTLDLASSEHICLPLDRELAYSFRSDPFHSPLTWSPDSTRLALVGQPFRVYRDTDLGLVDVPDMTFTNLSDDGYSGDLFVSAAEGATIESEPAFSHDNRLAVERTTFAAGGKPGDTTITVFDLASGDSRAVARLPGHEKYDQDYGSVFGMDWSPDNTTLAVSLRHDVFDPAVDGLWLLDVETGEWTQIVSLPSALAALQSVFPALTQDFVQITAPVRWSPDGSRLLVWIGDPDRAAGVLWAFWLDPQSGDLTPVPLPATDQDTPDRRLNYPIQAAWSPDGNALLVVGRLSLGVDPANAVPLAPDQTGAATMGLYVVNLTTQTSTLLGHVSGPPIDPTYFAAWAPDGSVIAGGYSFTLTHG